MEAKQLVFTMVCHYSDEADLDAVIDAVTAVLEDDSTVRSIGVERLDAPDEEEKYQCPRCHTVDIGDDTILDHGVCYACHKAEQLSEGGDGDVPYYCGVCGTLCRLGEDGPECPNPKCYDSPEYEGTSEPSETPPSMGTLEGLEVD